MKKIIVALLLISVIITPCYAVNIVDTLLCKEVVLCANRATVLVNRITKEVKYILINKKDWKPLTGRRQKECQKLYDAQITSKMVCH